MKSSAHRFFKILLIVAISIVALSIAAAKIISGYLEKTITEKLASAHCTIDSLDVDLLARSIRASKFSWTFQNDSTHITPHQIKISHISLVGIRMIRYLFYHELHISKIEGEDGEIIYNQRLKINEEANRDENAFDKIKIDELVLNKIRVKITSDTIPEYSATVAVTLRSVLAQNTNNEDIHYDISSIEALAEHVVIQRKASLYHTTIHSVHLSSKDGKIDIDSLRMNPLKGKYEFANSLGKQKTRVVLQIPGVRMTGFDYEALRDSIFSVSLTELHNADLSVFRDKRLPFKNPLIPLPMQMLKEIPFGIKLDTIRIMNATIVHEEITEAGNDTGKINLTDVNATISNFNNRLFDDRPPFAVMTSTSQFMKTGLIEASFFMPVKPGINYEAVGKISHLNLPEINTMTEAIGFLRIESGLLHRLNFNFQYNEHKSTGVLDINYENLKMISLNKNDKKNKINQFKTFILNAFVKKTKDKNTPKEERTGKIDVVRDPKRFVVNLWVKSLSDGLKSAMLPDTKEESPKK